MNDYVKINLTDLGTYLNEESSSDEMEVLGHFLTSDVGCYWPSFKEWAEGNEYPRIGGNLSDLEKEGDYILLKLDEYIDPELVVFKIPKQAFIELLNAWGKMCKQKPPHILITYNGQRFTVEGQGTPLLMELLGDDDTEIIMA